MERGGLSTWSLCNMALALLLEQEKAGCATHCAGHLLLGFLKYYGRVFDYTVSPRSPLWQSRRCRCSLFALFDSGVEAGKLCYLWHCSLVWSAAISERVVYHATLCRVLCLQTQAVAVKQGGIVAKADVALCNSKPPTQGADGPAARQAAAQQGRLCVEDPITGRDVSSGSHQIQAVSHDLTFSPTSGSLAARLWSASIDVCRQRGGTAAALYISAILFWPGCVKGCGPMSYFFIFAV